MQKDKSRIKDVWRSDELRDALVWCAEGEAPPFADAVRTVFEDASVRFSQGGTAASGAELYGKFARSIDDHFAAYPGAHTFIMTFDDKRHVPARKSTTQESRRDALERTAKRKRDAGGEPVAEWRWDGATPIVTHDPLAPLPPWEWLRLDSRAYARAVADIVDLLAATYRPPPGRRVIIDEGRRVLVVECGTDGRVAAAYETHWPRPAIGEADMSAQWYAMRAREGTLSTRRDAAHVYERGDDSHAGWHAPEHTETPVEWRVRSNEPIESLRATYEAGDVLLRSTDTDFVVLSLAWAANTREHAAKTYVSLDRVHLDGARRVVTASAPGAAAHWEYVDVDRLFDRVSRLHGAAEPRCPDAAWSFVAFCAACGNDYTRRLGGFSQRSMFTGYLSFLRSSDGGTLTRRQRTVSASGTTVDVAVLDATRFGTLLRYCYFERLSAARRPPGTAAPAWNALVPLVADAHKQPERHMPVLPAFVEYYSQVAWVLAYASTAPLGIEHVPAS